MNTNATSAKKKKKEDIDLATKSLEKGVLRLLQKRGVADPQIQQQFKNLIQHIRHLLSELVDKRASLRSLIAWFGNEWKTRLSQHEHLSQHTLQILQHTLEVFVRCQDGLVLLTSGECRHDGDVRRAKQQQKSTNTTKLLFSSKLGTVKERQDGYTCLYKRDAVYSGYGFDEFANETVGIQSRLIALLKRTCRHKAPWDWLEGQSYTQLVDALLDEHERDVKEMQNELQALKRKIMQDVKHTLATTKFTFVTQDKMERLAITYGPQYNSIRLERRADSFQLEGTSVLPSERQCPDDWKSYAIRLKNNNNNNNSSDANNDNDNTHKRRRLTIQDSDDDDDDDDNFDLNHNSQPPTNSSSKHNNNINNNKTQKSKPKKQQSGGLLVKVQNVAPSEETEQSVAAIKTQMGINADRLETARFRLEDETRHKQIQKEHHLNRLKSVLRRVQTREFVDDNEVWDARECLRQAYMEMGNDHLWKEKEKETTTKMSSSCNKTNDNADTNYSKAIEYFREAAKLVQQQQAAHLANVETANDADTLESRHLTRNLLFLSARASINIGIGLVEWTSSSQYSTKPRAMRKKKFLQAISEFKAVRNIADRLRRLANSDRRLCSTQMSSEFLEATSDVVRADQIESLACRWMGIALWSLSSNSISNTNGNNSNYHQEDQAIDLLLKASKLWDAMNVRVVRNDEELLQEVLEGAAECIYATSTLTDLACSAMERLARRPGNTNNSTDVTNNNQHNHARGDKLLAAVTESQQRQAKIRQELETIKVSDPLLGNAVNAFLQEERLEEEEDSLHQLASIQAWWEQAKRQPARFGTIKNNKFSGSGMHLLVARSDVMGGRRGGASSSSSEQPVVRVLATEKPRRRKAAGGRSASSLSTTSVPASMRMITMRRGAGSSEPSSANGQINDNPNENDSSPIFSQPANFRKWGDKLLSSSPTTTALIYPSVAPEMPPEIREFLRQHHRGGLM